MDARNIFGKFMSCKPEDVPGEYRDEVPQYSKGNYKFNVMGFVVIFLPAVVPLIGAYQGVPLNSHCRWIVFVWGLLTGVIGVTSGYHRLYSHGAYKASPFVMKLTAFLGAGAFQGSIKWWARLHRLHHKYIDTDKDPYNARRGFWFSHCGWICLKMRYDQHGTTDTTDLDNHPLVEYQREHFASLAGVSGILLPWFTAGLLFDDWWGGFYYCVFLKIFVLHQFTFCINSLAHTNWFRSSQSVELDMTPHDSIIFAVCNLGEGYHNFHHGFCQDYRGGYKWYNVDFTKWTVQIMALCGQAWDLYRIPRHIIDRATKETRAEELRREAERLELELQEGYPAVTDVMTMDDVQRLVKEEGRRLIIVEDYVLDLDKPIALEASFTHDANEIHWYDAHPGGRALLDAYIGRDATEAMSGGVYKHTHGARCTIPELRIAHLKRKDKEVVA